MNTTDLIRNAYDIERTLEGEQKEAMKEIIESIIESREKTQYVPTVVIERDRYWRSPYDVRFY